jgi:hypothetical protein
LEPERFAAGVLNALLEVKKTVVSPPANKRSCKVGKGSYTESESLAQDENSIARNNRLK